MMPRVIKNHTDPGSVTDKNFIIRDYRRGDFDDINAIWQKLGLGSLSRSDNEKTIKNSISIGGKMLLVENTATGEICGTSWMTFDGRRIHLHHFGILPEFQGLGLAKRLLQHSLRFVKAKGYQVKLEVHRTNFRGINLYKKAGFEYLGDYDVYIIRDLEIIDKYII